MQSFIIDYGSGSQSFRLEGSLLSNTIFGISATCLLKLFLLTETRSIDILINQDSFCDCRIFKNCMFFNTNNMILDAVLEC